MEKNIFYIKEIIKQSNIINYKKWKFNIQQNPGLGERIEDSLFTNDTCNYTGIRYDSPSGELSVWVGYWEKYGYCVSFCESDDLILRDIIKKVFKKYKEMYSVFDKHNWYTISLNQNDNSCDSKSEEEVSEEEIHKHDEIIQLLNLTSEVIKKLKKKPKKLKNKNFKRKYFLQNRYRYWEKIIYAILIFLSLLFLETFGVIKTFNNPESFLKQTEVFTKNCYNKHDICKQIPSKSISKTLQKNSDAFNLIIIICFTVIILTTMICFTIVSIRQRNILLKQEKLKTLVDTIGIIDIKNRCDKIKQDSRNENGYISREEEYYPPNKAKVDYFKAYTNVIMEL